MAMVVQYRRSPEVGKLAEPVVRPNPAKRLTNEQAKARLEQVDETIRVNQLASIRRTLKAALAAADARISAEAERIRTARPVASSVRRRSRSSFPRWDD